jgi:hypothetical protein
LETPIQAKSRLAALQQANAQGLDGPYTGLIVSITSTDDSMGVSFGPARERTMPINHPFVGVNSWVRAMPEPGIALLLQNRYDSKQPEAIKGIPPQTTDRSQDYTKGRNLYRTLLPGELDFSSSGAAALFFGHRGNLDMRSSGALKSQLSRDAVESSQTAPTHRKNLLNNTVGQMGDEVRYGIVKRWTDAVTEFYPQKNNAFQAEAYLNLLNPAGSGPTSLLKRIEGQVYDDAGVEIKHAFTSLPLRHQTLWYTNENDVVRFEVDQNGNVLLSLPNSASDGYILQIPKGAYQAAIGGDYNLTVQNNYTVAVQKNFQTIIKGAMSWDVTKTVAWTVGDQFGIEAPKFAFGSGDVEVLAQVKAITDAIGLCQIPTPFGPTAPVKTSPQWAQVEQELSKLASITGSL